jgi:ribulose-phosphate 3-epimerase
MIEIAPSLLSADFAHLAEDIQKVEEGGAALLHLDLMDGHFVPNLTIGPPVAASIRKATRLPLDAHLMVESPDRWVEPLASAGVNMISVHVEADRHLNRTLCYIKDKGIKAGVALNPATPLSALEEALPDVDYVLVMSVNPGFGGQHFIASSLKKIRRLREMIASGGHHVRIQVDGGVGPDNLGQVLEAGAEIIVAGSAVFNPKTDPSEAVRVMRGIAGRHTAELQTA